MFNLHSHNNCLPPLLYKFIQSDTWWNINLHSHNNCLPPLLYKFIQSDTWWNIKPRTDPLNMQEFCKIGLAP